MAGCASRPGCGVNAILVIRPVSTSQHRRYLTYKSSKANMSWYWRERKIMNVPAFQPNGLLPRGDYEVTFDELRRSVLVNGPPETSQTSAWDSSWRLRLVDNREILTKQLWQVGVREIYADGSFAEDKDHPNDIDGY